MSIFDYLFDSEWSQRSDLNDLDQRASEIEQRLYFASDRNADLATQVTRLRQDVSRLVLMVETLTHLVVEKKLCTKEEFLALFNRVDETDGVRDGKVDVASTPEPIRCPSCDHDIAESASKCIYCGASTEFIEHEPEATNEELRLCPGCRQNNPFTALRCIHCGAAMEEE